MSVSAVVEIPPLSEFELGHRAVVLKPDLKRPVMSTANTQPQHHVLHPGLRCPGSTASLHCSGLSPTRSRENKVNAITAEHNFKHSGAVSHSAVSKTKPAAVDTDFVALSGDLLRSLKITTAYQMFGIEELSDGDDVDAAARHAALIRKNMRTDLLRTDPVRGLVMMVLGCLHSWANRVCAHNTAALDMVTSMQKLFATQSVPGCRDCTPLLLALASTFELLVMFAAPGWLQMYLDPGSEALFACQLRKVSKFYNCSSLTSEPRLDEGVALRRDYAVSLLNILEGATPGALSPGPRPISPNRLTPRRTRQRAAFITQLCMVFEPARASIRATGVCSRDDMEREVEIVLRERRELRHLFSLLMKDLGFQTKQQKSSAKEVEELYQRLENVFRSKVCTARN